MTVLGAVFPHFRPDKREIWHGGADLRSEANKHKMGGPLPVSNFTFVGAACRPCGAKNPFSTIE